MRSAAEWQQTRELRPASELATFASPPPPSPLVTSAIADYPRDLYWGHDRESDTASGLLCLGLRNSKNNTCTNLQLELTVPAATCSIMHAAKLFKRATSANECRRTVQISRTT